MDSFWENSWESVNPSRIAEYISTFNMESDDLINILHHNHIHSVCDAGCGCGIYALKLAANGFYGYLERTSKDSRTIAEIIEDENGCIIGYIWVPFCFDEESGFAFADIQDIYIEENYRESGLATKLISYAEDKARRSGAKVIRSGTGCENIKSIRLHEKLGYYQYRYEFEKVL